MAGAVVADNLLAGIPAGLRSQLLGAYQQIVRNFRDARWEPSELNGGKFSEVVYTILKGYVENNYPASASKPPNMVDACRSLENSSAPRSIRIQIPRMLISLYEIRNNRGVGHVGGDVDPNHMDAAVVVAMAKWIVAELVRLFHNVDTAAAAQAIDAIVEREIPVVWEVGGKQRILDTTLTMKEKVLLILYRNKDAILDSKLVDWVEHSNPSVFRRDVLRPSHREKLVEYNEATGEVHISPKGVNFVETSQRLNHHLRG
jgi:hypothetical protein